ncbi:MAG: dUTP diphosphatase [Saccharofermentanales bacterium]
MSENVHIKITKCRKTAHLPFYAKPGDAGMDVVAAEDALLRPGETAMIPTGLKVAIPEGYEIQVRPRSGLSLNTPLRVTNSPGTIDSGYRDEICVLITNNCCVCMFEDEVYETPTYHITSKGNLPGNYLIKKGDRIAQIVLSKVPMIVWDETDSVEKSGNNRGGGFGSTGAKTITDS